MTKSEIRKHYFQDKYVIIAPKRGKRPHKVCVATPESNSTCYFCPENIERPVYEIHNHSGKWIIRVLHNAFPALTPDNPKAFGKQEVIVETPEHNKELHELPASHIKKVLNIYSERFETLSKVKKIRYVLVFKNEGGKAGTSIPHAHSQVIALPMVPPAIQQECQAIDRYTMDKGTCPYCDIIKHEKGGPRVAWEDRNIFALAPFASESPYGLWVIPKRHVRTLHDMNEEEKLSLANYLKDTLQKVDDLDLSYNYFFHNSLPGENHHLILKIAPRPNVWAGLELGTGVIINPIPPEEAAKYYRAH